ncbi:MAG TPA: lysyl oxidase family protein [Chthoniobacteraceae bacterium]|nr:lysyl oxidase family protein [Chthoniobacteraceae bacterium]
MRLALIPLLLLAAGSIAAAHDEVTPKPKLLQNGVPQRKLAAEVGEGKVFMLTVPPGAKELVVKTREGTGNANLYLRRNAHPTTSRYDFPTGSGGQHFGNRETLRVDAPAPGPWYILVDAQSDFRGVELTANYRMEAGSIPAPKFLPGPGVYAERAELRLGGQAKGTTLRYTVDGSEPTVESTVYRSPVMLTEDHEVRAKAFRSDGTSGPEASGWFFTVPEGEITGLESGHVLHHRAGLKGTAHVFRITVPSGQTRLQIRVEHGTGETELLMNQGSVPTGSEFAHRGRQKGAITSIDVENPVAGDWFIRLRGRTAFAGHSILAMIRPPQADLIVWEPTLDPYLSTETFTEFDCEVIEGMITPGTHRLLRFSTETRNVGGSDLDVPTPAERPDLFEFQECHGHFHFRGFASYRLLNSEGQEVATGNKVSFCLEDVRRWDTASSPDRLYNCSFQGIQAGWSDIYNAGLPGQWINVTGVPNGVYTLEVTMNPEQNLVEADFSNNTATLEVEITGQP